MNISRSVSYAVGILLRVAQNGDERPMTASRISKGCRFPPRFLYRILRRLVDAGLLRGVSGPGGGYALARSATKISLLEIVTAVEGARPPAELHAVHARFRKAIGAVNKQLARNQQAFNRSLKRITLARLARGD